MVAVFRMEVTAQLTQAMDFQMRFMLPVKDKQAEMHAGKLC